MRFFSKKENNEWTEPKLYDTCNKCKFFKDREGPTGECHYYPPKVLLEGSRRSTVYPEVGDTDFCGMYEAR